MPKLSSRLLSGRAMAVAGLLFASMVAPAMAQAPSDRNDWSNESVKPAEPAPPVSADQNRPRQPATAPPARHDEGSEAPPAGCRYRENKLDLLV